jgi:hypothetical protein
MDSINSDTADLGLLGREPGVKYPDGELLINEEKQDADIYFQYTCK